ncbi:MAG: sigma-70 family RNA polymerase sigma factor [Gemmataceae bacterium]
MTADDFDPELWIARARSGDAAALGTLLERYRPYLTLLARIQIGRRLQSKVDAADLVQETFLEAARCFGRFEGTAERTLTRWLRQVLANQTAHLVRRYFGVQARDLGLERSLADDLDASSGQIERALVARLASPSDSAARREYAVLVADLLESLPAEYREVIVGRQLEGLAFNEVAARLGRTVDSVQKLWVRGLAALKEKLEKAGLG